MKGSRVLDRYTYINVLKVGLLTSLIASLMLLGVDMFTNIYTYMNAGLGIGQGLLITMLYFPEAFLLSLGPAFLFSVTYHLSMLQANNEIMCILNSGISFRRVVRPCIILAVAVSVFWFVFNETVAIQSSNRKSVRLQQLEGVYDDSRSNSNVALNDYQGGYMVHASRYIDSSQTLYNVTVLLLDGSGRLDAEKAVFNPDSGNWSFRNCQTYVRAEEGAFVEISQASVIEDSIMTLEPQLFRNVSNEVSRMSLGLAYSYMQRMKSLNPEGYASIATEFYKRIFSCLAPFVLMFIACSINYRFKKNILFFSIITSVCIAVVYYVLQMITVMLADQAVIAPQLGILLPFILILILATAIHFAMGRQ